MREVHQAYIDEFMKTGEPLLRQSGFSVEVLEICGNADSTEILISKNSTPEYILCFATNHLDFADGVMVYKTSNRKTNCNHLVLPKPPVTNLSQTYGYSGDNLKSEIIRIVNDIVALLKNATQTLG